MYVMDLSTQICAGQNDVFQAFEFVDYFLHSFVSKQEVVVIIIANDG